MYVRGFKTIHREVCTPGTRLLILIVTAPGNQKSRQAIRLTWGHFGSRKDIACAFVTGRTTNPSIQDVIDKENRIYG